jgi:pimeloyl-ACP methyl ester carboxylesterase
MRTRELRVDGIPIHLTEAGEGPALILLHGLSATHVNWDRTIPAFADRWRVVAPDLPGHGRSGKPDAPYTIDFYAGVVRSLGRELGIREAVVVGNSLGGQIAVELALTYPVWTRALVLVAPAGRFNPGLRAIAGAVGVATTERVLRITLPRALERCFFDPKCEAAEIRRGILTALIAGDEFGPFARAVSRSLAGALAAGRQPLHLLTQPTLVVWGKDDRIVGFGNSRRLLARVPHARLVPFERCGHLPMLEHPERFNATLAEFLRAVDAAPLPGARRASGGT